MKSPFYRVVIVVAGLAFLLDGLALADFALHPLAVDNTFYSGFYRAATILILLPLTLLVGFLILRRVPGNVVGPLLFVWSGTVAYNSIRPDLPPQIFGLFYGYNMVFGWLGLFLMILHFPDGKIISPRAANWFYRSLVLIFLDACLVFLSQPVYAPSGMVNPFFLPPLAGIAGFVNGPGVLFIAPFLLLTLISPVLRYLKGSLLEQQQIKWLALFGGATVIYTLLGLMIYPLLTGGQIMSAGAGLSGAFFYLITGLFPSLAIGIAVLRYRLWDIDRLIRRTLVYSILVAVLALIYFSSVVVLQTVFAYLFQLGSNDLAIVLSTLAIAAAFNPLLARIRRAIDRRFFRQKYNIDQTIARFSSAARTEVVVDTLAAALVANIDEAIQPEGISLWLVGL